MSQVEARATAASHLRCHDTLADPEADQPVDTEIQN